MSKWPNVHHLHPYSRMCVVTVFALLGCSAADQPRDHVGSQRSNLVNGTYGYVVFGVRCQEDYQNGWWNDVGNNDVWNRCANLVTSLDSPGHDPPYNAGYYYNLHGAQQYIENTNGNNSCGQSCGTIESVDFFYMNTHSIVNSSSALWAMWDQNSYAQTSNMRLGNNGNGIKVLSTFSCQTLQTSDGKAWNRWYNTFAGGLWMTTGGHGTLYSGNDNSGGDFIERMGNNSGEAIGSAWLESTYYADNRNTPSVMNTGANSADCWNRQGANTNTIRWAGFSSLVDSQIGYMCWTGWNGS